MTWQEECVREKTSTLKDVIAKIHAIKAKDMRVMIATINKVLKEAAQETFDEGMNGMMSAGFGEIMTKTNIEYYQIGAAGLVPPAWRKAYDEVIKGEPCS